MEQECVENDASKPDKCIDTSHEIANIIKTLSLKKNAY